MLTCQTSKTYFYKTLKLRLIAWSEVRNGAELVVTARRCIWEQELDKSRLEVCSRFRHGLTKWRGTLVWKDGLGGWRGRRAVWLQFQLNRLQHYPLNFV